MRLLTITSDSTGGGSSMSLLLLLQGLKEKGVNIKVILPSVGYLSRRLDALNIEYEVDKYIRLSIWPPTRTKIEILKWIPRIVCWSFFSIMSYYKLKNIVLNFSPDIIHSNVSAITVGYKVAKKYKILHIWHVREFMDKDFRLKFYPSQSLRKKILKNTPSISISNDIQKYFDLSETGILIYNGIKSNKDTKYIPVKDNYYLFVGQISENKGVTDLIDAFISYRKKNGIYKLKIAGTYQPQYYHFLKHKLDLAKLTEEVEFTGQLLDVNPAMQKAIALIVPSKHEAFGRITSEAMFNGCFVIGRNTGGTMEQMDMAKQYCGDDVALRFDSVDELSECLSICEAMPPEIKESKILSSQEFVKNNLSTEINIEKTYEFLLRNLSESKRKPQQFSCKNP